MAPIVRIALEPKEPGEYLRRVRICLQPNPVSSANLPQLIRGLRTLSQSDPCAEAFQQRTGEWVILTAGELHLEVRDAMPSQPSVE